MKYGYEPNKKQGRPIGSGMSVDIGEYLTRPGATKLAEKIKKFWNKQGFAVEMSVTCGQGGWFITSDMLDGKPRAMRVFNTE